MWGVEFLIILSMIAMNGVFAAYEIALASISRSRLHLFVREGRAGATAAQQMKNNIEGSLAVVQLGITLVGAVAATTGGAGAAEKIAPRFVSAFGMSPRWAEFLALAVMVASLTVFTIVFGELIPKVFALRNRDWICLKLSPPMRMFSWGVKPVVWTLENFVKLFIGWIERLWAARGGPDRKREAVEFQELRAAAALARTSRLIGEQEEKIIIGAAALVNRPVREIMLPAEYISLLGVDQSLNDALQIARRDMHTRFPASAADGDPQGIVGYVNIKDVVARLPGAVEGESLRGIVRDIASFGADVPISTCLRQMIVDRSHIAVIRDDDNTILGMITMEDITEELVGEIEDEYDRLPAYIVKSGTGWIVGGGAHFERLRQRTGIELPEQPADSPVNTFAEWIAEQLQPPLEGGQSFQWNDLQVTVRKVRRQRVLEALVEMTPSNT